MKIQVPQLEQVIEVEIPRQGLTLLSVLVAHKIPLGHSCGGEGVCGTCWVELDGPELPEQDFLAQRLWKKQFPKIAQKKCQYFACLVKLQESDNVKTWTLRCPSW